MTLRIVRADYSIPKDYWFLVSGLFNDRKGVATEEWYNDKDEKYYSSLLIQTTDIEIFTHNLSGVSLGHV